MIEHYLKIGLRNICRYKQQSMVSIVGLAVGFVCFALSLLWIRYEMTFNQDYPDSDRIFLLKERSLRNFFQPALYTYLKGNYPEIEHIVSLIQIDYKDSDNSTKQILQVTPGFFEMFDIQFISGTSESFFQDSVNLLATDKELEREKKNGFSLENKLTFDQDRILMSYPWTIAVVFFPVKYNRHDDKILSAENIPYNLTGIVKASSEHSDFHFDYLMPFRQNDEQGPQAVYTFIKLHKGVDYKAFNKKLETNLSIIKEGVDNEHLGELSLYPLHDFHLSPEEDLATFSFVQQTQKMSFDNIVLLASAAFITILCLLFNYLALFMSRLQQIKRDIALRMAIGASLKELYTMMAVEFFLILLGAFLVGCLIVEIILPYFCHFTDMPISATAIFSELILYFLILALFSLLLLIWPLAYLKRQTFAMLFQTVETSREKRPFSRNALVGVQLVVGTLFIFCSVVFFKQIHYLKNIDPGFEPEGLCLASAQSFVNYQILNDETIKKIETLEAIKLVGGFHEKYIKSMFDKKDSVRIDVLESDPQIVYCRPYGVYPSHFNIWKIRLLQGEPFKNDNLDWNRDKVVISRLMANKFGGQNPIGQTLEFDKKYYKIIGVVSDVFGSGMHEQLPDVYFYRVENYFQTFSFRYKPGINRAEMEQKIEKNIGFPLDFFYLDKRFEAEQESEMNFMRGISILTGVCIVGALFGIYSMVSLACERRRKEIAIRKINGAGYGTLIKLFLKKYILLLVVACAMAFPTGYLLMKPWLEQFVRRINMDAWIFCSILAAVAVMISDIVIARIWRTLHTNPANEIRKE